MQLKYKDSLLKDGDLEKSVNDLKLYLGELREKRYSEYKEPESFINLPYDTNFINEVLALKAKLTTNKLKYLVVVGIGGSSLGTQAVYDALRGKFDLLNPEKIPKVFFADTNSAEWMVNLSSFLQKKVNNPDEILVTIISKSGKTTETAVNGEVVFGILNRQFGDVKKRIVIISDDNSELSKVASKYEIEKLEIPKLIGGRFSIFSPVGLFPLAVAGFDISAFCDGAKAVTENCLSSLNLKNLAAISAIVLYLHTKKDKNIYDLFLFYPELESLGKWHRQLLGESLGKTSEYGLTPTVSIGSNDLHSVAQLYLAGPKDKITTFVWSEHGRHRGMPIEKGIFSGLVNGVAGKSMDEIMQAIYFGTKEAYKKRELPFMEIVLSGISEYSLGQFMKVKMIEVLFLAKLMNINPFNQPNVEDYKEETRKILAEK